MHSALSLSDAERFDTFLEEVRSLSISARFGLAMCFVNEFAHRHSISGPAIDVFRRQLWECPVLGRSRMALDKWIGVDVPLLTAGDRSTVDDLHGLDDLDLAVQQRFGKILELTYDLLTMSFYGAGEDEGTFVALRTIYERSRPDALPSVTPFKFSKFEIGDGWGGDVSDADYDYWRSYSEGWWKSPQT